MTGSHEVEGSNPFGSKTEAKAAALERGRFRVSPPPQR